MPFGRDAEGALSAIIKDWSVNGTVAAMVRDAVPGARLQRFLQLSWKHADG